MVRREPEEEKRKGGAGTPRDLCHIVEKLNNCRRLRLVNLPIFRLGVLFSRPGNIISGRISCNADMTFLSITSCRVRTLSKSVEIDSVHVL
ncbi:hypothetical protein TNCV_1580151 [Trichonephila clavipes]|nr:hypothetical protein TNCV_1580151 [Trichonephila clavipes]